MHTKIEFVKKFQIVSHEKEGVGGTQGGEGRERTHKNSSLPGKN